MPRIAGTEFTPDAADVLVLSPLEHGHVWRLRRLSPATCERCGGDYQSVCDSPCEPPSDCAGCTCPKLRPDMVAVGCPSHGVQPESRSDAVERLACAASEAWRNAREYVRTLQGTIRELREKLAAAEAKNAEVGEGHNYVPAETRIQVRDGYHGVEVGERAALCASPRACAVADAWASVVRAIEAKNLLMCQAVDAMPDVLVSSLDALEAATRESPHRKVRP